MEPVKRKTNKGRIWLLTIKESWTPPTSLPDRVKYICGQLEKGEETGFLHWQVYVIFDNSVTMNTVKEILYDDTMHCILCDKSEKARNYCLKENSYVRGRFELGTFDKRKKKKEVNEFNFCKFFINRDIWIKYKETYDRVPHEVRSEKVPEMCMDCLMKCEDCGNHTCLGCMLDAKHSSDFVDI